MNTVYEIKVLTPEFQAKLNAYLEEYAKKVMNEVHMSEFTPQMAKDRERYGLNHMWNNTEHYAESHPEVLAHYHQLGLLEPQYTTMLVQSRNTASQVQARIEWKGEIKKIDDIDEIFSFTVATKQSLEGRKQLLEASLNRLKESTASPLSDDEVECAEAAEVERLRSEILTEIESINRGIELARS
jgi:hypothetical protein